MAYMQRTSFVSIIFKIILIKTYNLMSINYKNFEENEVVYIKNVNDML